MEAWWCHGLGSLAMSWVRWPFPSPSHPRPTRLLENRGFHYSEGAMHPPGLYSGDNVSNCRKALAGAPRHAHCCSKQRKTILLPLCWRWTCSLTFGGPEHEQAITVSHLPSRWNQAKELEEKNKTSIKKFTNILIFPVITTEMRLKFFNQCTLFFR